jgi:ribosome biogenesis protein MAK21
MKAALPKDSDNEDLLADSDIDEEDDDLPSNFSAAMASDDDDEDLAFNDNDNTFSLVEASGNKDLIPLDEMPDDLIAYDGTSISSDADEEKEGEKWGGIDNMEQLS